MKIQICYTLFTSIFCRSCQIQCFLHTVTVVQRSWNIGVVIWHKNMTQIDQPFWNSSDSVQKAVDLTIPAKNRRKMRIIYLNFEIKKFMDSACRLVWNWPSKSTTHAKPDFLWNVNGQIATVWNGKKFHQKIVRLLSSRISKAQTSSLFKNYYFLCVLIWIYTKKKNIANELQKRGYRQKSVCKYLHLKAFKKFKFLLEDKISFQVSEIPFQVPQIPFHVHKLQKWKS